MFETSKLQKFFSCITTALCQDTKTQGRRAVGGADGRLLPLKVPGRRFCILYVFVLFGPLIFLTPGIGYRFEAIIPIHDPPSLLNNSQNFHS